MSTKKTRAILAKLAESSGTSTRSKRKAARPALEALGFPELKGATRQIKDELAAKLLDATRGKAGKLETLALIEQALSKTRAQVEGIYETVIARFLQLVELGEDADADPRDRFVYAGPIDSRTRPFCRKLVGRVFRRRDINSMDNGQIPDVFLNHGGWRCRHLWRRPLPRHQGVRPGGFVSPTVRRRVQAVQRAETARKRRLQS